MDFFDNIFDKIQKKNTIDDNTSIKDLTKFSKSKDEDVRQEVAKSENCTLEILDLLSKDEDDYVRRTVAENPNCSKEILEILKDDEDSFVRRTVAKNSNCSKEILEILKDDDEIWVNEAALEKLVKLDPKRIDALLETGNKNYLNFIANFSETPEKILLKIAENCDSKILRDILSKDILKEKSIESLFKKHKGDEDFERFAVGFIGNNNTPVEIFKEIYSMLKDTQDESMPNNAISNMARNKKTPTDILIELSDSVHGEIRENVAMNIATPLEINVKLASDPLSYVINEALTTLYEKRTEPKDKLLVILKDIVGKLSVTGQKVGEFDGTDVTSGGLLQEDVDFFTEKINERIKELEG